MSYGVIPQLKASLQNTAGETGPTYGPEILEFSSERLRKLRGFTGAAAQLIAVCLKPKIGTAQFKTLRQEALFDLASCQCLRGNLRPPLLGWRLRCLVLHLRRPMRPLVIMREAPLDEDPRLSLRCLRAGGTEEPHLV
jgi:hypothetical protein